jgi:hypothetical protein
MQTDLNQLAQYATYALTTFVTAGCGAYPGSYLRKKEGTKRSTKTDAEIPAPGSWTISRHIMC